jgi:hypothetical protein
MLANPGLRYDESTKRRNRVFVHHAIQAHGISGAIGNMPYARTKYFAKFDRMRSSTGNARSGNMKACPVIVSNTRI